LVFRQYIVETAAGKSIPDGLQRKLELLEIVHDVLELGPITIAPAGLMIAESEVLLHGRQSNRADLIILGYSSLGRTGIEVQINTATDGAPSQTVWL
jgi:hypothetical protein